MKVRLISGSNESLQAIMNLLQKALILRAAGRLAGISLLGLALLGGTKVNAAPLSNDEVAQEAALLDALASRVGLPRKAELQKRLDAARADFASPYRRDLPALERWMAELQRRRVQPAVADDATFLRRAYLDLTGKLPPTQAVAEYLASPPSSDKRAQLVDHLLATADFQAALSEDLASLLQVDDGPHAELNEVLRHWLRESARARMPWDQMVRRLLTAEGSPSQEPAAAFLLSEPEMMLHTFNRASKAFLGQSMNCAFCHDDPFGDMTTKQVYQFAAFFSGLRVVQTTEKWPTERSGDRAERWALLPGPDRVTLPPHYPYRDGKPGQELEAASLQWCQGPTVSADGQARKALVSWLIHDEHWRATYDQGRNGPLRLASTLGWSVWQKLFGQASVSARGRDWESRGADAVMRYDNHSCAGNPDHSSVFDEMESDVEGSAFVQGLGAAFLRASFDLPDFYRILCHTQAYQRQARDLDDLQTFAGAPMLAPMVRRLTAVQIKQILQALATHATVSGADFPELLGGEAFPSCALPISPGLTRWMANGKVVELATVAQAKNVVGHPDAQAVEELFYGILARRPSAEESLKAQQSPSREDVAWALLNTSEFLFRQ